MSVAMQDRNRKKTSMEKNEKIKLFHETIDIDCL